MEALPLSLFDYELPQACIAQSPAEPRDTSRLLVLPRDSGKPAQHTQFLDFPSLLEPGDVLVVNRTRVIPARLPVRKATGGKGELLLCRPVDGTLHDAQIWEGLGRPGAALQPGRVVYTPGGEPLEVIERNAETVRVRGARPLWDIMAQEGALPLPPYIRRDAATQPEQQATAFDDAQAYQSMFGNCDGAVAAPTASLHFTPRVMEAIAARGVQVCDIVLHVGPGTFLPIRPDHADDVRQHRMHREAYDIPQATLDTVARARAEGKRIVAVGTTALRALETWAQTQTRCGESHIFVYPGYQFQVVDALLTNFHLPKSTLLLLVSALAGRDRILAAYREAVVLGYRFFSYGDAMFIG